MGRVLSGKRARMRLRQQVAWGRLGLLVMMAVSLVNQLLLAVDVPYHFLFSAAVPYYLNWSCAQLQLRGALPVLAGVLTAGIYGAYFACWLLSGRYRGWLAAAVALYATDTLLLIIFAFTLLENAASCILEILVHGMGLAMLLAALRAAGRLSRMPKNIKNRCKEGTYDEFQHCGGQAVPSISGKSAESGPV